MKFTLLLALAVAGCDSDQTKFKTYEAWKLAQTKPGALTFEQYTLLKDREMLPGVDYAKIHAEEAQVAAQTATTLAIQSMATK